MEPAPQLNSFIRHVLMSAQNTKHHASTKFNDDHSCKMLKKYFKKEKTTQAKTQDKEKMDIKLCIVNVYNRM